jgi:hypothetical protein
MESYSRGKGTLNYEKSNYDLKSCKRLMRKDTKAEIITNPWQNGASKVLGIVLNKNLTQNLG